MAHETASIFDRATMKQAVAKWAIDCGGRLRLRRTTLGLSREQLASMTGTTEPTIARIEAGSLNARDDLRWIFAGVLQCSVGDIWQFPTREAIALHREVAA